jgi:hypothetical protein
MFRNRRNSSWPPTGSIVLAVLIVVLTLLQAAKSQGWL